MERYSSRLAILQRVLPFYRAPFFDALADACEGGLSVYAGQPRPIEAIDTVSHLEKAGLEPGKNIHILSGGLYCCWQCDLLGWLERTQPSALIVEANPRYLSTPRAVDWMRARGKPVIGWGLGAPSARGGWTANIRRSFIGRFDALITYSQQGAEEYRRAGFPADAIFVARNAAAPRPSTPPPSRPDTFAAAPVILFVGRLQARKRVDTLLRACAALPEAVKPEVWIVGDGPARAEFEATAHDSYPDARFFGAMRGAELDALFDAADLFVLPGTGGLAVQQAMSRALPVVVGEADGTQADLVRPENGWQVPAGDVAALARILQGAISDTGRLRQMGAASYRIVAEEINLEAMVDVFLAALRKVSRL